MSRVLTRNTSHRFAVALLAAAALQSVPARSGAAESFDPRAMELLRTMSATVAGAKTLSVRSLALYDAVQPGGIAITIGQDVEVQLKRPARLHARVRRDDGARRQLWFDGKAVSVYDADANSHSVIDAAGSLDEMFLALSDRHGDVPLSDLLVADPYAAFEKYLLSAAYVGLREIDGVAAHHLSFESQGADFQLWVSADERALPLRFAISYVGEPGEPGFIAVLRDWELTPHINDGVFAFHAPDGAKKVPFDKVPR